MGHLPCALQKTALGSVCLARPALCSFTVARQHAVSSQLAEGRKGCGLQGISGQSGLSLTSLSEPPTP